MLLERFFPDLYIQSIYDLPLAELKEMGIRGLVFDIDNTVAPFCLLYTSLHFYYVAYINIFVTFMQPFFKKRAILRYQT